MFKRILGSLFSRSDKTETTAPDTGDGFEFGRADEQPYEHYTDTLDDVKQLKREKRHDEAEELLLWCIDYTEVEARDEGTFHSKPAPAYYRHLGIVYRKDDRHADEVALLERYVDVCKELGADPDEDLIDRHDRAQELASSDG